MLNPTQVQYTIINTSTRMLKKKVGIVTRVGIAARLVMRHEAIAKIANIHNANRFPDRKIANRVTGVSTQP